MARSGTGVAAAKLAAIGNDGWPNVLPIEALDDQIAIAGTASERLAPAAEGAAARRGRPRSLPPAEGSGEADGFRGASRRMLAAAGGCTGEAIAGRASAAGETALGCGGSAAVFGAAAGWEMPGSSAPDASIFAAPEAYRSFAHQNLVVQIIRLIPG